MRLSVGTASNVEGYCVQIVEVHKVCYNQRTYSVQSSFEEQEDGESISFCQCATSSCEPH